jgi:hypothetical protein
MPDHVIEVKPTGPTTGDIVWEWHLWDHLIQDFDPRQNNYGVVTDHPELVDINFGKENMDWNHINSIDYNEEFDQIILSSYGQDEIWIIDHSTTTEEAAGHTGGNSGKGGDILYRWGNPQAYRAGDLNDKKLFGQHDAQWIESGCPGEGNILVFNNGENRPNGKYSSIDEIVPPVDANGSYFYTPGNAYGPEEPIWIYTAENPTDFYSYRLSGAHRIPNGNTLVCDGPHGYFFEVTLDKELVWEYTNPYPSPLINQVFKIRHYEKNEPQPGPNLDCEGSFNWKRVKIGKTVNDSFKVKNIGDAGSLLNWKIVSFPSWGNWSFNPEFGENLTPEDGLFTVELSVEAPDEKNKRFEGYIRVENIDNPDDLNLIPVFLKTPRNRVNFNSFLLHFLERIPFFMKIIYNLIL